MNLDSEAHQSGHSKNSRKKRATSMDEEFHDSLFENDEEEEEEDAPVTNPAEASSHASSYPSDDDSEFGEADDDQLPDQAFLEAILIDYHPDRLNLLEPENGEPAPEETPAPTEEEPSEEKEPAAEEAAATMEVDQDDSIGDMEEEKSDAFTSSPTRPPRPHTKSLLQSMGTSTKKSFRKMSGTFWAKSFKNLGRSMTRSSKVDS